MKTQQTIWQRMNHAFSEVTAIEIGRTSIEKPQSFDMTFRKAEYIKGLKIGYFQL